MNKFLMATAVVVAGCFSGCSKDGNEPAPNPAPKGKAYLSLDIQMPTSSTYASTPEPGTPDESSVTKGYALTFTGDIVTDVITLDAATWGTIGNGAAPAGDAAAFLVTEGIDHLLLVLNPDAQLETVIHNAAGLHLNNFLTGIANKIDAPITATAGHFTMINACSLDGTNQKVLVDCTPSEDAASAAAARTQVNVERLASKVRVLVSGALTIPTGSHFDVTGWKLSAVNKSYIPCSDVVPYTLPTGNPTAAEKYRRDANFSGFATVADISREFTWLTNTGATWNNPGMATPEYCHENTVEAASQNFNNLTKVIIKAEYAPAGVTLGDSWFRYNGAVYKSLDELKAAYTAAAVGSNLRNAFDKFLEALGVTDPITDAAVTIDVLNNVADGGYKAAKADVTGGLPLVQFFQKSVCYYYANINHDNRVENMGLGCWGIVRNNCYTLTLNSITKAGLTFIPDPTDAGINDSGNPDPTDPDDAQSESFISVVVTVDPWSAWTQGMDF